MRTNFVAVRLLWHAQDLLVPPPNGDVFPVGLEDVVGHVLEPFRAVDLERLASTDRPGGENQIGITNGVIRMEVSEERYSHLSPAALVDTIRLLESRVAESGRGEILETAEGRERKLKP